MRWVIYIVLGGAINAVAIRSFGNWMISLPEKPDPQTLPTIYIQFFGYGLIVVLIPILLSFVLSRVHPEKRIVPPLFMNILAVAYLIFFAYFNVIPSNALVWEGLVGYAMLGGLFQDRVATYALGRTAPREKIFKYSCTVHADIHKTQKIILRRKYRKRLGAPLVVEAEEGESLKLKSYPRDRIQTILEIVEGDKSDETTIHLAVFEKRAYDINFNEDVEEAGKAAIDYLEDIFFKRNSIKIEPAPLTNADILVDYIVDEMLGAVTRFQEMSMQRRFSIIIAGIIIVVAVGLLISNLLIEGITTLVIGIGWIIDVVIRR